MSLPSLVSFFVIVVAVIIGDVLCVGIQPRTNRTWSQIATNNNVPLPAPQQNSNLQSTTPWPALGQRRHQQPNPPQNARLNNQPMWVRPDNSPNWVRNTPTPSRNAPNANTNFLNNERGGVPNVPNQRPNSNKPSHSLGSVNQNMPNQRPNSNMPSHNLGSVAQNVPNQRPNSNMPSQSQVVNPAQSVGGGGSYPSSNNNNRGVVSAGSMSSNSNTATQNEGSDNTKKTEGDVEDFELREFSEELLSKDSNNAARFVTVNVQGMTTSRSANDEAPLPLLSIDSKAYSIPSVEKLMLLYNNYILETNQNEVYTAQEKNEENSLLDTILSTPVMQHTRNFLIKKGKLGKDPKDFKDLLRAIWFGMYSRGQGRIGSSGFEHVFLAELKNNQVSGLHNWVYFNEEEKNKRANYLGYMRKIDLGNKGSILKYHFTFHGVDKPVGSMFIGTSPELEIALYSTCFVLRADKICPLKMGGNRFIIRTFTYRYRGKNMIGSAFPEI